VAKKNAPAENDKLNLWISYDSFSEILDIHRFIFIFKVASLDKIVA